MKFDSESRSTVNHFKLTTTEAMSSYEDRFVKIRVVFHKLYFENEVSDPPMFLYF